jgi:hypothetical protein
MRIVSILWLIILVVSSCNKSSVQDGQLTASQLRAAGEIVSSFQSARIYNDSLVLAQLDTSKYTRSMMLHFDSLYHRSVDAFNICHGNFEHTYVTANHSHDMNGTVIMHGSSTGGMMGNHCSCCNNGGHDAIIHTQMIELATLHIAYHPR